MKKHWAIRLFWWLFATVVVTMALLVIAARALFPYATEYKQEIELWMGGQLGQSLSIGELDVRWRHTYPEVIFRKVDLLDEQGASLNTLPQLSFSIDLAELLLNQKISFIHLSVALEKLTLQRDAQGKISVAEFPSTISMPDAGSSDDRVDDLLNWLLRQGDMKVTVETLAWLDQQTELDYHFTDARFALNNDRDRHQIDGTIKLPYVMGASLQLAIEVLGNPLRSADWWGKVYLKGESISLPHWLQGQPLLGKDVNKGTLDISLWSEWRGTALNSLQGELALYDFELENLTDEGLRRFESLASKLDWQRLEDGWQLALNDLTLSYQGHRWPLSQHVFRRAGGHEETPQLALQSGYLDLGDSADLLNYLEILPQAQHETLVAIQPGGELKNISGHYVNQQDYSLRSDFEGVSASPWLEMPGVENFSGQLTFQSDQAELKLDTQKGQVEWPGMFRDPLALDELKGDFTWHRLIDSWTVFSPHFTVSNSHLASEGAVNLSFSPQQGAFLDLALNFLRGDMSHVSRYLPVGIMTAPVVNWLDQGIAAGTITEGGLIYHGAVRDFPFKQGEGNFDVDFEVSNATIVPQVGWQPIREIEASVRFPGAALEIEARSGQLLSSNIEKCRVSIDDMLNGNPYLAVSAEGVANTADAFDYLLNSPLHGTLDFLNMFHSKGESSVALAMAIPLSSKGQFSFDASADLKGNALEVLPAELQLNDLSGRLHLSMEGLHIERVEGTLYEHAITLTAETVHDVTGGAATLIQASSELDGEMLSRYLKQPVISAFMQGHSELQGEVYIPHQQGERVPTVALQSSLQGIELSLPGELAKQADERRRLSVDLSFAPQTSPLMKLDYAQKLGALVSFDKPSLRGQIILGSQVPQLPEQSGLDIRGELSHFSLREVLAHWPSSTEKHTTLIPDLARHLQLKLMSLELFGQSLQQVELLATRVDDEWFVDIISEQAKGMFQLSERVQSAPLVANMEYLHLGGITSSETSAGFAMHLLPPMQLHVKQFSYESLALGELQLKSRWVEENYYVDELLLHPDSADVYLQGKWLSDPRSEGVSSLNLNLKSKNLGRTISGLGYAGAIEKGQGRANAAIRWPGGLADFSAAGLHGDIDFKFEDGRVLDVEPGAGRMLGLLSVQMLPRRLLLDFSDLFAKGFSFDEIRGHYKLDQGVAETDNFTMLGASARVDMLGKVDLAQRSYDQRLIITPYVTESIPMLSFLTGLATPQVAAAIYFAQKVFQDDLEKIAQFEYHVTGPWDDPTVIKLEEVTSEKEK